MTALFEVVAVLRHPGSHGFSVETKVYSCTRQHMPLHPHYGRLTLLQRMLVLCMHSLSS
jgi:hypothetical protein